MAEETSQGYQEGRPYNTERANYRTTEDFTPSDLEQIQPSISGTTAAVGVGRSGTPEDTEFIGHREQKEEKESDDRRD